MSRAVPSPSIRSTGPPCPNISRSRDHGHGLRDPGVVHPGPVRAARVPHDERAAQRDPELGVHARDDGIRNRRDLDLAGAPPSDPDSSASCFVPPTSRGVEERDGVRPQLCWLGRLEGAARARSRPVQFVAETRNLGPVSPSETSSPVANGVSSSTRLPFANVPIRLERSTRRHVFPANRSSAWRPETTGALGASHTMSESGRGRAARTRSGIQGLAQSHARRASGTAWG